MQAAQRALVLVGHNEQPHATHLEDVADARAARQLADRHVLAAPVQHGAAAEGNQRCISWFTCKNNPRHTLEQQLRTEDARVT